MQTLVKWIPMGVTVIGAIVTALSPDVQGFWATHPAASALVVGVWAAVKGLLPSPLAK